MGAAVVTGADTGPGAAAAAANDAPALFVTVARNDRAGDTTELTAALDDALATAGAADGAGGALATSVVAGDVAAAAAAEGDVDMPGVAGDGDAVNGAAGDPPLTATGAAAPLNRNEELPRHAGVLHTCFATCGWACKEVAGVRAPEALFCPQAPSQDLRAQI